jgi:hypothetical protein
MYQDALSQVVANPWEVWGLTILLSMAVALFGFALATHRQYGLEAIKNRLQKQMPPNTTLPEGAIAGDRWMIRLAMAFFIFQDIAGVIYSFFGHGEAPSFPLVVATISIGGFTIVPFFTGHMTLALAESLPQERKDQFYAHLFDLWQDTLITAASKWAKQARHAEPADILAPVIKTFLDTSPDGLYTDAMKGFFRMDGEKLIPFRPKAESTASASNGANQDDEE